MNLAGLAEEAGDAGPVRTAVISAAGMVFLVKTGETFRVQGATYRVSTVAEDGVEIVDDATGTSRWLALK